MHYQYVFNSVLSNESCFDVADVCSIFFINLVRLEKFNLG